MASGPLSRAFIRALEKIECSSAAAVEWNRRGRGETEAQKADKHSRAPPAKGFRCERGRRESRVPGDGIKRDPDMD